MKETETGEELLALQDSSKINWLNVETLKNKESIQAIAASLGIHPLTVEDILDTEQRPKLEEFDDYIFLTFKAVNRNGMEGEHGFPRFEQISLILKENLVITFQELPGDSFDGIRKRILNGAGRVRKMGADYLAYAILDAVVNDYYLVLDDQGERIEDLGEQALEEQGNAFMSKIQSVKRSLLQLRRVIWPLREALGTIPHLETEIIREVTEPFFKDVQDSVLKAAETLETYRELLSGVMDINLSSMSNRMNGVMKVLTIISTVFIPLTFIVGVYGMNFKFMPELDIPYAYPICWAVMVLIVIVMFVLFKKRHWI